MKKILVSLMAAVLLLVSVGAVAEGGESVSLSVRTENLPLYNADDPRVQSLPAGSAGEAGASQVLVIPLNKDFTIQTVIAPQSVRNKKTVITAGDGSIVRVQGNKIRGMAQGETTLTVASEADPSAQVQYRVVVIQPVKRLTLTPSAKSVGAGKTISVVPSFQPADATLQTVAWTSANPNVATVDAEGNVTGVSRGTARITAMVEDGSNVRANISIQVTQDAEQIVLDRTEVSVAVKRNVMLKATVLPASTTDKRVIWSSSDPGIATVNNQGRVTGVALGDCEITCVSAVSGEVQAKAAVHVLQPVEKLILNAAPAIYVGESAKLTWSVQPDNASNTALTLKSANPKIVEVTDDGTITGLRAGQVDVNAATTDGSNRRAKIRVEVFQHLQSVQMKRNTAYIDLGETSTTGAVLTPGNMVNKNMTWEVADPSIASVAPLAKQPNRINVSGLREGRTRITGTTEDGGLQTSMDVVVGNFEDAVTLIKKDTYVEGDKMVLRVRNDGIVSINNITATVTVTDIDGDPVPCTPKGDSTFKMVYKGTLAPGESTSNRGWKVLNYEAPYSTKVAQYEVRITEFQIEHDWVKVIRRNHQPRLKCPVHI